MKTLRDALRPRRHFGCPHQSGVDLGARRALGDQATRKIDLLIDQRLELFYRMGAGQPPPVDEEVRRAANVVVLNESERSVQLCVEGWSLDRSFGIFPLQTERAHDRLECIDI